jgi:3-keto-5-aminohexanoate cleavage enzyme
MGATPENLIHLVGRLPAGAVWQVIAIGRANLPMTAIGLAMGGNARTGMEDTLWLRRGCRAQSNAELIGRVATLVAAVGRERATVDEAAAQLGLTPAG